MGTHFTDTFIRRPVLATVISILILLCGLKSFMALQVRQYPEMTNTVIKVNTIYPGATAETIQGFITTPLQQKIAGADGVEYVTSVSRPGSSFITAKVRLDFSPEKALTEVIAKVAEVKSDLPQDALDPVIIKETGSTIAMIYIALNSAEMTNPQITDFIRRQIQPKMTIIPGVSACDILGGQTFAMRIWLDPARMAAYKITAEDVAKALRDNNYQTAGGSTKGAFTSTDIITNTELNDANQFRQLIVKSSPHHITRLQDIARIELAAQDYNSEVILQGKSAVFLGIKNTPDSNPLTVVSEILKRLPEFQKSLPSSLKMQVVYDSTRFIKASIDEVFWTLIEATLIVMVIIILFMGNVRAMTIPIVTIPLSLIGTCTLLAIMGFSINLLTLLAMVIAIGLVVDDAIVVVENVYRHIREGKSPFDAAMLGTREIKGPVITMTLTLMAVYAPIAFMGGLTGALFKEFALTLAGAVLLSGIIALTLSPMMCSKLLQDNNHRVGWLEHKTETLFQKISQRYRQALISTLNYKKTLLSLVGLCFALIAFFFKFVPKELAPYEDQGFIFSSITAPQSTNLDYLSTYSQQVNTVLSSQPESELSFMINGTGNTSDGIGIAIFKPWNERQATATDIASRVMAKFVGIAGIKAFAFQLPPLPTGSEGMPVQFVISGMVEHKILLGYVQQLQTCIAQSGLFMFTTCNIDYNNPQLKFTIDHDKANFQGVTMQNIGSTLALLMGGNLVNRFNLQGRSYQVITQVPRQDRLYSDRIKEFYVRTAKGGFIPIGTLLRDEIVIAPNQLFQMNQINSVVMSGMLIPGVALGKAIETLENEATQLLPPGFSYDHLAESRQYKQEGNALFYTFIFAVIVIFLVLAGQFESFHDPLIIMLAVPLSLFGALLFLFLGYATINIYTQIGLITLVGLITKHGILIVEFANQLQKEKNIDRHHAVIEAATIRLRPIVMTTAAMVLGLIPLLSAHGAGAASRFSIGIVVVSGMIIGTVFTLFIVPLFYKIIAQDHRSDYSVIHNNPSL